MPHDITWLTWLLRKDREWVRGHRNLGKFTQIMGKFTQILGKFEIFFINTEL